MTWRAATPDDRRIALLWLVAAGLFVLMRPVWLILAATLPICPWHAWSGWPCPGCGTTRAVVRLLNADLAGAVRFNPLAACAAAVFVGGGPVAPVWLAAGGRIPRLAGRPGPGRILAASAVLAGNWAWLCFSGV